MQPTAIGARNQRLRRLRRLVGRSKARSEERAFVVDGPRLVADALAAGIEVTEIYAAPGAWDQLDLGRRHAAEIEIECFEVDASVLASVLDPVSPQPVAAVATMPAPLLDDLVVADGPILVAIELRDPGNLGTIIRTAEAAGMAGVVVAGDSVDQFSPKVVRASAGSLFRLPVADGPDITATLDALLASGRAVVATVVAPGAGPYDQIDLTGAAILIGNEPNGLPADVVERATVAATIPMAPGVESLNVGAAASVLCFEAARQRRAAGSPWPEKSVGQPPEPVGRCPE